MRSLVAALLVAAAFASGAGAAWLSGGGGSGAAQGRLMPAGNVPGTPTNSARSVTVSWAASTFADGTPVPAYVVRRFNEIGGAEEAVLSGCSGLVAATTCVEDNVPFGSWTYTVTPAAAAWLGTQSGQSASVVI